MDIINFAQPVVGNFIVKILIWLAGITSSIAVAIVLFTVLLKLVTLPFDYFSKASMRKNSLKMEEMRPELEKLQKQYANDKALYNQKMMALYKKNGYSMFGSCLPTILTLVIFIFALNGFTDYSQYQNRLYFYNMSNAYNSVIYDGVAADGNYITKGDKGEVLINYDKLFKAYKTDADETTETRTIDGTDIKVTYVKTEKYNTSTGTPEEIQKAVNDKNDALSKKLDIYNRTLKVETTGYVTVETGFTYTGYTNVEDIDTIVDNLQGTIGWSVNKYVANKTWFEKVDNQATLKNSEGKTFNEAKGVNTNLSEEAFILDICQQKSADKYHEEQAKFLWIKNLWVSDSPLKNPVEESWATFRSTHEYPNSAHDIGETGYAQLTMKLEAEKTQSNGYFILVVLTAGISFLTQWVMKKSSQAQMELQTVDGQGAQTQKIMMIMMPVMMAFFAFMYTSAFSIYIILSSVINIGTTFGINKIVDVQFKKAKSKEKKDDKVRGRVYVPKEEPQQEQTKTKKAKKKEPQGPDFLTGTADGKKKIRGRLK